MNASNSWLPVDTPRLQLRAFRLEDIDDTYLGWLNDSTVTRFSNQRFRKHTADTARRYVESFVDSQNLFLAIDLREPVRKIGTMTAYVAEPHLTADMGIMIGDRSCWGQGYGLEAWCALMDALFAHLRLRKVTGGAVRSNEAMVQIMRRSGMLPEAVRARQEIVLGKEEDVLYFARFADI